MKLAGSESNTVTRILEARVAATPDAIAYCAESVGGQWDTVTWGWLGQRVQALALALHAKGLRKGDAIALIAPVSLEWELIHYAALSLGAVIVGLDAHDVPERIAAMADKADVVAFAVAEPRVLRCVAPTRLSGSRFVVDLSSSAADNEWPRETRALRMQALAGEDLHGLPHPKPPEPHDRATIIFTSGTTGTPKAIAYRHDQVCLAIAAIADAFNFVGPGDRTLCWLPLSNLFQRVVNLSAVQLGVPTWLLGDPRRVMDVVTKASPVVFIGVPRFYEKLMEGIRASISKQSRWRRWLANWAWETGRRYRHLQRQRRPIPLSLELQHRLADRLVLSRIRLAMGGRVRCMVSGSAPMQPHLLEEFHALGWLVLEAYGMSENIVPMAMNRLDDYRFGTVGRPLPENRVMIDNEGHISVSGEGVFSGYLGGESAPIDAAGFFRSEDLGELDGDGFLRILGRSDEIVKLSSGHRVSLSHVEAQLRAVPGIDQAVVMAAGRRFAIALCSCTIEPEDSPAIVSLGRALAERLAQAERHSRPRAIGLLHRPFSIERGELTSNLKIRRASIEASFTAAIEALGRTATVTEPNAAPAVLSVPDSCGA